MTKPGNKLSALLSGSTRTVKTASGRSATRATGTTLRWCGTLLLACIVALGTACASKGRVTYDADDPTLSSIADPRARRLLSGGDIQGASDVYTALAERATEPALKQDYQLIAAEILYDRGMTTEGLSKLEIIPDQLESTELEHRRAILQAKDALFNSKPELALKTLPDPEAVESNLHKARVFEVRAQSYRQLQNPDEELLARISLEEQLQKPGIVQANHQQIWQLLTTQPLSTLNEMTTNVRGDIYQGWIELALANADSGVDPERRAGEIESWKARFPGHPAQRTLMATLYSPGQFGGFTSVNRQISQIGVLLPLTGQGISQVAEAIRDGIIVAYQQAKSRGSSAELVPEIRFYDTGDNVNYVRTAFQNALNDGSDAIIGPLRKEAVSAIITQRNIPVPVLTLNTVESAGTGVLENVVQFGLAPEDEARSAAIRALGSSYRNAIVLQTDDSRGDRVARAFAENMLLNGGDVVHTAVLPTDEYDYSKQIKDALLITQSDQRFRAISRTVGAKLFFEPSIRGDVDMVFLALNNEQARAVRPQLAFFRAGKLPMLATSRVAAIDDDVKANSDLNGIFYTDAPWMLDRKVKSDPLYKEIVNNFPDSVDVFGKLYALGLDSWKIINSLKELSSDSTLTIPGFTGNLSLTVDGRIQRALSWAKYDEGRSRTVKNINFTPAVPTGLNN